MDRPYSPESCDGCPDKIVCRCLLVSEAEVIQVITRLELRTIKEVRREIGAGDGCMCCHPELREYLEKYGCAATAVG